MRKDVKKEQPVRLSNDELRKSRAGKLGCFPSDDLYEPEQRDAKAHGDLGQKGIQAPSNRHEKPRE